MASAYPAFLHTLFRNIRSARRITMQTECSFAAGYGGRSCAVQKNIHYIKAHGNGKSEHVEPVMRPAAQETALTAVDGAGGSPVLRVNGAFYLNKDKSVSLSAYQINFSGASAAKIAAQDFEPVSPQPGSCHQLSVSTTIAYRRRSIRIPGAVPSVQQVQTSGDDVP